METTKDQVNEPGLFYSIMKSETSSFSVNAPREASNYDELLMHDSLLFADSLKDLKNLRKQLYSAAEYFELSYRKDDHEQLVVETLKDYVTKALVSTVDHLGSVAFKVNNFLDEKVNEVSATNLRFSCIEQRLRTCQDFIDRGSILQHSFVIETPKYHKQYILPVRGTTNVIGKKKLTNNIRSLYPEDNWHQSNNAVQATTMKPHLSVFRKSHSRPLSTESSSSPGTFSFTRMASNKELDKQVVSPHRFSLKRTGSLVNRSLIPSCSNSRQWYPSEPQISVYPLKPQRSVSMSMHSERDRTIGIVQSSKKSKSLLKALLSLHKSKKDGRLYRYKDDN